MRRSSLLLLSAVTAVEVGDDDGALAAFEGLERLDGRIADPYLESAARWLSRGFGQSSMTSKARSRPPRQRSMVSTGRTNRSRRGRL